MWKLLAQVFGSRNQRLIKELSRTVAAVNGLGTTLNTQFTSINTSLK